MCGVVGYFPSAKPNNQNKERFRNLMIESRIRGVHAWGYTQIINGEFSTIKANRNDSLFSHPQHIDILINSPAIGHTRYSTSGDWEDPNNNQPLVFDNVALSFNGVVDMRTKEEMEQHYGVELKTANDGELAVKLGQLRESAQIENIPGTFAGAWLLKTGELFVGRNKWRPLWFAITDDSSRWVASTQDIFHRAGFDTAPTELIADQIESISC